MRIGIHLPTAGGLKKTADRAREIGARSLQIFSGNPRGWVKSPLDEREAEAFRAALAEGDVQPLVVHATYLINLAAPDETIYQKSQTAFLDDARRARALGAKYYVIHPGSPKDLSKNAARARVGDCLKFVLDEVPDGPEILLETTAGMGSALGATFEELAELLEPFRATRVGVCYDTCHTFVAGYDQRTAAAVKKVFDAFDATVGLQRLRCVHLNDSRGALASHLDRHAHVGEGELGTVGLSAFFGDKRLWADADLPAILETPQDEDDDDARDMRAATELAVKAGAVPEAHLSGLPAAASLMKKSPPPEEKKNDKPAAKQTKNGRAALVKKRRQTRA